MELNLNSWFISKYLQCDERDAPRTICALVGATARSTLLYAFLTFLALAIIIPPLATIFNIGQAFITGQSFHEVFADESYANLFLGMTLAYCGIIFVFGATHGVNKIKDARRLAEWQRRDSIERGEYVPPQPSKVWQVVKGIYARIKDKTCVIITYK